MVASTLELVGLFEAEDATLAGGVTVEDVHAGFSGTGFADFGTDPVDTVTWTLNVPEDDLYQLEFGYANGGSSGRELVLEVDGQAVETLAFASTGAWDSYQDQQASSLLQLGAGTHEITLRMDANTGPNVDYLRLFRDTSDGTVSTVSYETESATLENVVITDVHAGFTGSGFGDFQNASGDFVEWTVDADSAGDHQLDFRYALGKNEIRSLELTVNGTVVDPSLDFGTTGAWDSWSTVAQTVALDAGANTVRLTSIGDEGANIDRLDVTAVDGGGSDGGSGDGTYETESATLENVVITDVHAGFTGSGFGDFQNASGDFVEWTVDADSAGDHQLDFRYALGKNEIRSLELTVNGTVVDPSLDFGTTGAWDSWSTVAQTVALDAGANTVRLTSIGDEGANIDRLDVTAVDGGGSDGGSGSDGTAPDITLVNPAGLPTDTRHVFNMFDFLNVDLDTTSREQSTVRIVNDGDDTLAIDSLVVDGPWSIASNVPGDLTVAPGDSFDVVLDFDATGGDLHFGQLTINSNDPDEAAATVDLAGFWQQEPERGNEPDLDEQLAVFGYQIDVPTLDEFRDESVRGLPVESTPDEVVSYFWEQADPNEPVSVRQISAFHTQGGDAGFRAIEVTDDYDQLTFDNNDFSPFTTIASFIQEGLDSQTFLPREVNSESPAEVEFDAGGSPFVMTSSIYWSDAERNSGNGYFLRFYEFTDENGVKEDDKYLLTMDYGGGNYDFNDNVYLVDNISPLGTELSDVLVA